MTLADIRKYDAASFYMTVSVNEHTTEMFLEKSFEHKKTPLPIFHCFFSIQHSLFNRFVCRLENEGNRGRT